MKQTMQAFVRTNAQTMDIELATVEIPALASDEVLVQGRLARALFHTP